MRARHGPARPRGVHRRRTAKGETGILRIAYMDFAINGRLPELFAQLQAHAAGHNGSNCPSSRP